MRELYEKNKLFFIILILLIIGFLVWYFSEIIIFVIVAGIVSVMGSPLVELLDRIHIGKLKFPHVLSVTLTLLLLIAVFFGFFSFFIPLIFQEANMISSIDSRKLAEHFQPQIDWLQSTLIRYGVIRPTDTVESLIRENFSKIADFGLF